MKWINDEINVGRTIFVNIAAFDPFDGPCAQCYFCKTNVHINVCYWHWPGEEQFKWTCSNECHKLVQDCELLLGHVVHDCSVEIHRGTEVFSSSERRSH